MIKCTRPIAIVVATLSLGALLLLASPPAPAAAATKNAGIAELTPDGGYLGNYLAPDGSRVYCIDSPLPWPSGSTSGPSLVDGVVTTWGVPLPPVSLQKLNYVLLAYGQTDDPVQAAAVAAFVNAYTSGWARDLGAGYDAGAWYLNGNAAAIAVFDAIWADAQANAVPADTAALSIEMTDATTGTLLIAASRPEATGFLVLEGAVRTDDGASEFPVSSVEDVDLRGIPSDDARDYAISAVVTFTAPTPAAPNLTLYVTDGQQRTIRGGTTGSAPFGASTATDALLVDFAPVLSTAVARETVALGEPFIDTVTAAVEAGGRPWRERVDGSAVPIVAEGVLYGPFTEPPATSDIAPAGAPVAGSETLTLTGPGEYQSSGAVMATRPGYYTWVWSIRADHQEPVGQASLPVDYSFVSPFGLAAETHRVPQPALRLAATGLEPHGAAVTGAGLIAMGILALVGARRRPLEIAQHPAVRPEGGNIR